LGEAAARDKERKEKEKSRKPAKSYTEEDLRGKLNGTMSNPGATSSPTGTTSSGATTTGEAGASPAPAASPSAEDQEALAKNWRDRRDFTNGEISRIQASITSFESRLADNTQPMYGPGRDALVKNLERAKADLVRAQADLATLEAEGRDKGYR
jgi:hypothetical protein